MCEITAVTSGKGGTGKTMVASNLAALLAMGGERVLLMDMNAGLRNLDICLGMENQVIFDLADVINGVCSISRALIKDNRFESLYLLSASQNIEKAVIREPHMIRLCEQLESRFDHIIIDTPGGLGCDWKTSVAAAGNAIIVMTQEYVSVRDTDAVDAKLRELGIKNRCIIVNRVKSKYAASGFFPSLNDISESLRTRIIGVVQDDMNIHVAMNKGVPVVCKNDTYIRKNFEKIRERIFE
jgi:septum site-determining protein MinD